MPPFSLDKPKYDQSDYWGRVATMRELTDMSTLLATDAEIAAAQQLLEDFKSGKVSNPDELGGL